jgi:D-alanyl-D-alanine dipeptidase
VITVLQRRTTLVCALACLLALHSVAGAAAQRSDRPPPAVSATIREYLGEYGPDGAVRVVLEDRGQLWLHEPATGAVAMRRVGRDTYRTERGDSATFRREASGRIVSLELGGKALERRTVGPEDGQAQLRITPVRPVADLLAEARRATPPEEKGEFLATDLVELTALDPTIKLDVRYATTNNFLGSVFYREARAFLQRPAAEALVRAHQKLRGRGYGLLVFDGYRPWYVTKVFWDATPDALKEFVADPAKGSRHNRGCAVDLTLYDLRTGSPVEMVATYDETTARAAPDYPGGTALQRWHRRLLRESLEAEGFTVYSVEWWHFDYKDWERYRIGNVPFEALPRR